jgi:hypothetical protein
VHSQDTLKRLGIVTLIQSLPFTIGLYFSIQNFGHKYPEWLNSWLWISYGVSLAGQLRARWVPYLLRPYPARGARYRTMFGSTHSFLPERHGMVPHRAHIMLHIATVATLMIPYLRNLGSEVISTSTLRAL